METRSPLSYSRREQEWTRCNTGAGRTETGCADGGRAPSELKMSVEKRAGLRFRRGAAHLNVTHSVTETRDSVIPEPRGVQRDGRCSGFARDQGRKKGRRQL